MLIALFIFEIIIVGLTIFTTHMVEHKFKMIEMSLGMYCNKRTYKTKANIDFIEAIMNTYRKLTVDAAEEPDLESAIKRKLQREYIGKFPYISVKNVAVKARYLMWGILGLEVMIAWINQEASSGQMVILITASLLLTIIMAFYGIIKGLDEKSEALIDEVIHYVRNIYPLEQSHMINGVASKQSTTISLEAHKVKRESLKINERQVGREQPNELKNQGMQTLKLHKKKSIKMQEIIEYENNKSKGKKDIRQAVKQNVEAFKMQQEAEDVVTSKYNKEKQCIKSDAKELSAIDIAKLLEHL